jgi:hypothetical protein
MVRKRSKRFVSIINNKNKNNNCKDINNKEREKKQENINQAQMIT